MVHHGAALLAPSLAATDNQNMPGGNPFPTQSSFASTSNKPATNSAFQFPMSLSATFGQKFKHSMTQSWSLSVEQQLTKTVALHVAYVGSESYHQSLVVDENPGINNVRIYSIAGHANYSPNIGEVFAIQSGGTANYHSLQASVDKHLSKGLQIQSNFTWSKVIDIASEGDPSQGNPPGITNPFSIRANRGISDLNRPLISTTNFVYTSPALSGKSMLVRKLLGQWGLSSIYSLQSGRPFGISASGSSDNSGSLQDHDRADFVAGVSAQAKSGGRSHWLQQYVNPAAFQDNAAGTFGDSGRNIFRAPYLNSADTAITKNWAFEDRYNLQFRGEMFNTFNHASFDVPASAGPTESDMQLGTPSFGQVVTTGPIPARVMQGALKLTF